MARNDPETLARENAELQERLRRMDDRTATVARALIASRSSHAFEHALAWAALAAMALANALAFLWAR